METVTRNIESSDGTAIEYTIAPLRPSQNLDLALEIMACVAKPGARLIRLAVEAEGLDAEIDEILESVDFSDIGADVEAVFRALAANPKIVRRLFSGTFRDGADLSNDAHFDQAYAGNYTELFRAVKTIIQANGLIPFLDTLGN